MTLLNYLRTTNAHLVNDSLYNVWKFYRNGFDTQDYMREYDISESDMYWSTYHNLDIIRKAIASNDSPNNYNLSQHGSELSRTVFNSRLYKAFTNMVDIVQDEYIECNDCGEIELRDHAIYVAGYDNYVGSCCSDNYRYHENHDEYYHEDDYPYDEEDDDGYYRGVYGYDYDVCEQLSPIHHGNETRLLATEIEVERRENCSEDIAEDVSRTLRGFALCKHDGSLNNGFEIVTAPATITALKEGWNKFCEANYTDQLSSWHTSTCGMHIHVDRKSLTPLEIGKLLVFVNGRYNSQFMEAIAGRDSQQWSAKKYKGIKDALQRSDKYEALATHKPRTIEFRIFRGNIGKIGIMRNIEFVDALCNFVRTVGMDKDTDTVNRLSYTKFIEYMNTSENKGSYPYLFSWLVRKGYNKGKSKNIQNESEEN